MTFSLPYGNGSLQLNLYDQNYSVFKPEEIKPVVDQKSIVENALSAGKEAFALLGSLENKRIAIGINDQSRPIPNQVLLPSLMKFLNGHGAEPKNVHFYIATGTHSPLRTEEFSLILESDILSNYQVICHDCDDKENQKYLGNTTSVTPVFINRKFLDADIKILVGNIESHHFMGFSGGVKTAAIGLAGRETITANHSMLSRPNTVMGLFSSNPMRRDVEEIGKMIGIDYVLNVVINDDKEIISAYWGDPSSVILKGIEFIRKNIQLDLDDSAGKFDLVIASPGGYPKDINLYQAQKAITHACLFSIPDGVIILAAECRDGIGSKKFEEFLVLNDCFQGVIKSFKSMQFEIGPHKAYQLAKQAINHKIILVSDIDAKLIQKMHLMPAKTLDQAIAMVKETLPENPKIAVLPYATHTMPKILEAF